MKETGKPKLFYQSGNIVVMGPEEVVHAIANALNDENKHAILPMESVTPEQIEAGEQMKPADIVVEGSEEGFEMDGQNYSMSEGFAFARFGFLTSKPVTHYLAEEASDPANWNHPRNDKSHWFWAIQQILNIVDEKTKVCLEWMFVSPEDEVEWQEWNEE